MPFLLQAKLIAGKDAFSSEEIPPRGVASRRGTALAARLRWGFPLVFRHGPAYSPTVELAQRAPALARMGRQTPGGKLPARIFTLWKD